MPTPAEPVVVAVRLHAKSGRGGELARILVALTEYSRTEEGCVAYLPHADPSDADGFFLLEHWTDAAALDRHRDTPHFQRLAVNELKAVLKRSEPLRLIPLDAVKQTDG